MIREFLRGAYDAAWLLAAVMFALGWAAAFTTVGAVLILAATVLCLALFTISPRPVTLLALTVVLSLGWFVLFLTAPWLLLLPATLLVVARRWHHQRRHDHGHPHHRQPGATVR